MICITLPNFTAWGQYLLDFLVLFGLLNLVWAIVLWLAHSIKFLDFLMRIGRSVVIFGVVFVICTVFHLGLW